MEFLTHVLGLRKPVRDYSKFRLSAINQPRYQHLKLLGGWLVYFALYFLLVFFVIFTEESGYS